MRFVACLADSKGGGSKMNAFSRFPLVDDILGSHQEALGSDLQGYRNHVTRVLTFLFALAPDLRMSEPQILIAAAFHDLGIWTARTFDYLAPSSLLAHQYLETHGMAPLWPEVDLIIQQHHKLRPYRGPFSPSVEAFRRADLVDVSLGLVRFGLSPQFVQAVRGALPNAGFHARLLAFTGRQFLRTPLRPLPMIRW
jgi:hypothetical protein